jgi:hypothetical protein
MPGAHLADRDGMHRVATVNLIAPCRFKEEVVWPIFLILFTRRR